VSLEGPLPKQGFWYEDVDIGGELIKFKLDPGAAVNTLPEALLEKLRLEHTIRPVERKLTSFGGHDLTPKGMSTLTCKVRGKSYRLKFIIVGTSDVPLLGLDTCDLVRRMHYVNEEVGLSALTIQPDLQQMNDRQHKSPSKHLKGQESSSVVEPLPSNRDEFLSIYKDRFKGLGRMPGEVHIDIDKTVKPQVSYPNRLPQVIMEKAKKELDIMEKNDVAVPEPQPKSWVCKLLFREKEDGSLRPCIDPRLMNKAVQKDRNHRDLPIVSQIVEEVADDRIFTCLDYRQGFWQATVDEESSQACAVATLLVRTVSNGSPLD